MKDNFFIKAPLILLLVLLFFYKNSFSQTVYSNTPSARFSFTGGLTVTDLLKDTINYSAGTFFNGGFAYSVRLNDKLNLNADLLYTGKAVKTENPIVRYRYFYVDFPLYLQYNMNDKFRFNLGAQYSIFTNSFVSLIDGSNPNGISNKKYKNIKNTDYGFLFGAELDLNDDFNIGVRYTVSGSTFFAKNQANFGVFNLVLRYTIYKNYRQFFVKKTKEE